MEPQKIRQPEGSQVPRRYLDGNVSDPRTHREVRQLGTACDPTPLLVGEAHDDLPTPDAPVPAPTPRLSTAVRVLHRRASRHGPNCFVVVTGWSARVQGSSERPRSAHDRPRSPEASLLAYLAAAVRPVPLAIGRVGGTSSGADQEPEEHNQQGGRDQQGDDEPRDRASSRRFLRRWPRCTDTSTSRPPTASARFSTGRRHGRVVHGRLLVRARVGPVPAGRWRA